MRRAPLESLCVAAAVALFAGMLLPGLESPLFWHDEGDTAMFATRILEVGYPKVHGPHNVLYEFGAPLPVGVEESTDAYIGKTWGDYYFAVPGVWWAQGTGDPYARTFRVRLPFALAGGAGVFAWLWGVLPALPPERRRVFAAAYFAASALSISLLLHLREARYYPLLVLALGALAAVHLRGVTLGALSRRRYAIATALLLPLLFQVFFVAWFPALACAAADAARAAWRGERGGGPRARRLARALAPHAVAVLLTLPALVFFETLRVSTRFADAQGAGLASFAANLRAVLAHFLRHEWLAAAVLARATAAVLARRAPREAREATSPARACAARLCAFAAAYAAFGCLNPLVYERYFVALSPALTLSFLLDAFSCARLLAAAPRALRRGLAFGLALLVVASLAPRRAAIAGHLAELREPVKGPVDYVVAHLRQRYPDPSALLVATNYEAQPLMYYLGSRVIVGLALGDIGRERGLEPDVVIPRRRWPRSLIELRRFLARGRWREERLPVVDTHYNDVPSLTPSPATPDPHRFRTPACDPDARQSLRVFERIGPASPPAGDRGARTGGAGPDPPPGGASGRFVSSWSARRPAAASRRSDDMGFHHVAISTRDVKASHEFYTGPMGFELVKVQVGPAGERGFAKHLFYDAGDGQMFAVWDFHDPDLPADWSPAISTALGLPIWANHIAFHAANLDDLARRRERWLAHGVSVMEIDHGWCTSIYARDPNGILVEFCASTRELGAADREEALRRLADPAPERDPEPEVKYYRPRGA